MGVTYDLIGTLRETKVFGFRGKYGCKACPYEKDATILGERERAKEIKYHSSLNRSTLELDEINHYRHVGLAFGVCGTIDKRTVLKLAEIGYPSHLVKHLQMLVMSGSACICVAHMKDDRVAERR